MSMKIDKNSLQHKFLTIIMTEISQHLLMNSFRSKIMMDCKDKIYVDNYSLMITRHKKREVWSIIIKVRITSTTITITLTLTNSRM